MRLLKLGECGSSSTVTVKRESEPKRGLGTLREPYLHFNFSKGVTEWLEKHNRYSSQEAGLA